MSKNKSAIAERFKSYEFVFSHSLPRRIPVIVRIDGRAFHTYISKVFMSRKYNTDFTWAMSSMAGYISGEVQGCNFAYGQSDEISFLLTDYEKLDTQPY